MDQYQSQGRLLTDVQRHWSIRISLKIRRRGHLSIRICPEIHMDQWLPNLSESSGRHWHRSIERSPHHTIIIMTTTLRIASSMKGPFLLPLVLHLSCIPQTRFTLQGFLSRFLPHKGLSLRDFPFLLHASFASPLSTLTAAMAAQNCWWALPPPTRQRMAYPCHPVLMGPFTTTTLGFGVGRPTTHDTSSATQRRSSHHLPTLHTTHATY